jgi:enoyl-CoA hydratase/carnithine racemase
MGKILVRRESHVEIITLSNPSKHNALDLNMWDCLRQATITAVNDSSVRVIVIRGEGTKAFSAGANISEFEAVRSTSDSIERYEKLVEDTELALAHAPKPTICLLHGICAGGGSGIALACSVRIADEAFRFSIPAAKLGVTYHQSAVTRLVAHVGPGIALDLLMSARDMCADEAIRTGLVTAVYRTDELTTRVMEYTDLLAHRAPLSIRGALASVQAALNPNDANLEQELLEIRQKVWESADYKEGIDAFLTRRAPIFLGR